MLLLSFSLCLSHRLLDSCPTQLQEKTTLIGLDCGTTTVTFSISADLTVLHCSFRGATYSAIVCCGSLCASDSSFSSCTASEGGEASCRGGAIDAGSECNLTRCVFDTCSASRKGDSSSSSTDADFAAGGAIYTKGTSEVISCVFMCCMSRNEANTQGRDINSVFGGAMYCVLDCTVTNCSFSNCRAINSGNCNHDEDFPAGGAFCAQATSVLIRCVFINCTSRRKSK